MTIKIGLVYISRTQTPYYLNTQVSRCDQKLINGRSNLKGLSPMVTKIRLVYIHIWEANAMLNKYIDTKFLLLKNLLI